MILRRMFDYPKFDLGWRAPFGELERMRREMDTLAEAVLGPAARGVRSGVFPALNLTEDKDNYYVRAELPGIKGDDLDIQATGKTLAISGERKIQAEDANAKYHRREREAGKFSRVLSLPGDVDTDKVDAALADGVLTVTVPKAEVAKPKQITVK